MLDLTVIGDVGIDTYYLLDERDAAVICNSRKDNCELCFELNEKIPVKDIHVTVGGNAANVSIGCARLGFSTGIITTVGRDADGKTILLELEKEDVHLDQVNMAGRTNQTVALIYETKRTLLVHHEDRDYHIEKIKPSRWIYLTSMTARGNKIIQPLTEIIGDHNIKLAFSPGTYQRLEGPKPYHNILEITDIIMLNKQEAEDYTSKPKASIKELLLALTDLGPSRAIITDGTKGSYGFDGNNHYSCKAFPARAIETTGAGDAYSTGVVSALMEGNSLDRAMQWGSANAASVVEHIGPHKGLLSRVKLLDIIK